MARIPDDKLDQLKRNVSILHVCAAHGIELKRHGTSDYIGSCPFPGHDDDEPSFIVTPSKNLFHCLGCDAGGSVIDLVMKLDGITFREAVDKLMTSTGLITTAAETAKQEKKPQIPPERANQLIERAITLYERALTDNHEALEYFKSRGITDQGMLSNHRAGYCAGTLKDILPKSGEILDELEALGILNKSGREHFRDCVVFPVTDVEGNIVTLYGRHTGDGSKRHVFLPRRSKRLWNGAIIKTYPEIIVVESVIDALSVETAGLPNVVAIHGSGGISDNDIADMKQYSVSKLTLLLDGDEAGNKAAERLCAKLSDFQVVIQPLPEGHDPNSYLQAYGPQKLAELIETKRGVLRETIERANPETKADDLRNHGLPDTPPASQLTDADGTFTVTCGQRAYRVMGLDKSSRRLKVTVRVEHAGRLHVDTLDLYSSRSRKILAGDLCRLYEETAEVIEADVSKIIKQCEVTRASAEGGSASGGKQSIEPMTPRDKAEAKSFGQRPDLVEAILADFEKSGLVGEESNKLLCYLAAVSRKMSEPLSLLVLSSSGAGKTALQDCTLSFVPPEDLVKLTSLSGKALFYKERLALKHKVLALEEGDGAEEATYAIRNLISAGELVIESTIKDLATGRLTTMENRVEGPTSVFITTTDPNTDPETKSRFFITSVDESRDQTRRILDFQRRRQTLDGVRGTLEVDAILKRHRNFQRLLKPLAVVNPFAERLTYEDDRLQGRRDHPKYLNLIKAITFLRQMQRNVRNARNSNGETFDYIEVTPEDVRLANKLSHEILGHSLDELSRPSRNLLMEIEKMVRERLQKKDCDEQEPLRLNGVAFSRREIRQYTGWSNYRVHTHLRELIELEYVSVETDRMTNGHRYRLLYEGQGKDGEKFMLGLTDPDKLN